MTATEIYLSALKGWKPPKSQQPKRLPVKSQKPRRLAGGCLLYRFPGRLERKQEVQP